eukprot:g10999.t1
MKSHQHRQISKFVTAEVPLSQLTNVPLKSVPDKFKEGTKLKLRVLSVRGADSNRVVCTAKKDFVKLEPRELLLSEDDVRLNAVHLGWVGQVQEHGVIVRFFGDKLHGLVPCKDPEVLHSMKPGMLAKVRVVGDKGGGKLKLSFDLDNRLENGGNGNGNKVLGTTPGNNDDGARFFSAAGNVVAASGMRIFAVDEAGCFVTLPNRREAYIQTAHLSDDLQEATARYNLLEVGKTIEECLGSNSFCSGILLGVRCHKVHTTAQSADGNLCTNSKKYVDLISLKQCLQVSLGNANAANAGDQNQENQDAKSYPTSFVRDLSELNLSEQRYFFGYVKSICSKAGVFISLGDYKNAVGIAPTAQCTDHYCVEPADEFRVGQTVRVLVKKGADNTSREKKLANFDLRQGKLQRACGSVKQNATIGWLETRFLAKTLKMVETLGSLVGDDASDSEKHASGGANGPLMWRPATSLGLGDAGGATIAPGDLVRGKVVAVRDYGVFLEPTTPIAGTKVKLLAFAHNVDDFEQPPAIGSVLDAFVLDVNPERRLADVSLRSELLQRCRSAKPAVSSSSGGRSSPDGSRSIECEIHLAKTDRTIFVTTGKERGQYPEVVFAANADAFNRLQTAAVTMQRGMFARKQLLLSQKIAFGGENNAGKKSSAWIAHYAPEAKEEKEENAESAGAGHQEKGEAAADVAQQEGPQEVESSSRRSAEVGGLEVSRISDPESEAKIGTTLNMRVHSISPTAVLLQCPCNVWGHLHATDLPLSENIVRSFGKRTVATTRAYREKEVVCVKVERVSDKSVVGTGAGKAGAKGTQLLVSPICPRGAGVFLPPPENEGKPAKKRKIVKNELVEVSQAASVSWASLKEATIAGGKAYRAVVVSVGKDQLLIELGPGIRGRISVLDADLSSCNGVSTGDKEKNGDHPGLHDEDPKLFDLFVAGQVLEKVYPLSVVKSKKTAAFSMVDPKIARERWFPGGDEGRAEQKEIPALVTTVNPKAASGYPVRVSLPLLQWAQVHLTELGDSNVKGGSVLKKIKQHQQVRVKLSDPDSVAAVRKELAAGGAGGGGEGEGDAVENAGTRQPLRAAIVDGDSSADGGCATGQQKNTLLSNETLKRQLLTQHKGATEGESSELKLTGVVKGFSPTAGLFVALTPDFSGRVQFRNLAPALAGSPPLDRDSIGKEFPVGRILQDTVRILTPSAATVFDEAENHRLELSLIGGQALTGDHCSGEAATSGKTGTRVVDGQSIKTLPAVGDVVSGTIRQKKEFGLFIRLDQLVGSPDGLCHVSEIEDRAPLSKKKNTPERRQQRDERTLAGYCIGQKVANVKVLKVENGRISLSMRPSVLKAGMEEEGRAREKELDAELDAELERAAANGDEDEEGEEKEENVREEDEMSSEDEREEQEASGEEACSEGDEDDALQLQEKSSDAEELGAESDEEEDEDENLCSENAADPPGAAPQAISGAAAIAKKLAEKRSAQTRKAQEAAAAALSPHQIENANLLRSKKRTEDEATSIAGGDGANGEGSAELSPAAKRRKKLLEDAKLEEEIRQRERDTLDNRPKTADDFERLLLSEGGKSSYLWLQYIAYHLELSEVQKARTIAERGIKHISFASDTERLNVWVGYLNLEAHFGDANTLLTLFQRACQYNKAKTCYLKLGEIQEKRGKLIEAKQLFQDACRKFKDSKKAWIGRLRFLYQNSAEKEEFLVEARELLPKALQLLERRKHVATIQKAAALEFEHGSCERGRTLFESLLAVSAQRKRLDLWNVFLDLCARKLGVAEVRKLYETKIAELGKVLKDRKMKFFFKKWLEYEARYGDEEGQIFVKKKAKEFVETDVEAEK